MKRLLAALTLLALPAQAATHEVADVDALRAAIAQAEPGDVIQLAPGDYRLDRKIVATRPGPVTVRGPARILSRVTEAFQIAAPDWTFTDFTIEGACARQHDCEHAFHIVGAADRTALRGLRMIDFNAQVKGNGDVARAAFPDDVLIEDNVIFDRTARDTDRPVAKIDVVGGERWIVRGNVFADFAQGHGRGVAYGVFLKLGSRDGLIERNVAICEWRHHGGFRVALSLGGSGGGSPQVCPGGKCWPHHRNGTFRDNVVTNCPRDAGIYVNRAVDTLVQRNTLYRTLGIDVRFPESSAVLSANVISGGVLERDGGKAVVQPDNVVAGSLEGAEFPMLRRDDDLPAVSGTPTPRAATPAMLGTDELKALMRDPEAGDFCLRDRPQIGAKDCDVRAALARLEAASH
jgi:hypothetical protein